MHWIAPSERETATDAFQKQLWDSADHFRANSGLKAQEYSGPILGSIFLRFSITQQIQNLRRTRDLVLPRLPSGRLN